MGNTCEDVADIVVLVDIVGIDEEKDVVDIVEKEDEEVV
jgi:hypothetical protein